jgi:hypothetical protein
MDYNLTVAIAGTLYFGPLCQWSAYANALTAGKIAAYKRSTAYRSQSLTAFFRLFRSLWDTKKKGTAPNPDAYGLTPIQPEGFIQSQLIDKLIGEIPAD